MPASPSLNPFAEQAVDALLRPLRPWLDNPQVSEVMINAADTVWVEEAGRLRRLAVVLPAASLRPLVRLFATLSDASTLERDATLEGGWRGWRVTAVLPPVARSSPCLCLRRHHATALPLADWRAGPLVTGGGALPGGLHACLLHAIAMRHSILVSGSTGAGKTTFLAGLIAAIDAQQRVVCLEDSPELPDMGGHQLRLLARSGHSLRSLLRLALRLRPDRIVIGEVRGAEAFDLLQAMACGHAGCLGTIHAPHARGALRRLEQLILLAGLEWPERAVRAQIAQCVQLLVHVSRAADGRCVSQIQSVVGLRDGEYDLVDIALD